MIYLLAEYAFLFLLTAIVGFVLGHWWSRRNFVDVSESYEDLRRATERDDAARWDQLWGRFDALPQPKDPDLAPVFQRLDAVSTAIDKLPAPEKLSLETVETRLDALAQKVAEIPGPVDLAPISERLADLDTAVRNLPEPPPQQTVNLAPVETGIAAIKTQIGELPKVQTHEPVDLAPMTREIEALQKRIDRIPQPATVDLGPLSGKVESLQQRIERMPAPEKVDLRPMTQKIESLERRLEQLPKPDKVDMRPIESRLGRIERDLERLGKRSSSSTPARTVTAKPAAPKQHRAEPKILSAALYGKKDDLKLISGVGPKLERLLNDNGVFYFWQVASWSRSDIDVIDERLDVFKGRISRDDWVKQARQLRKSPDAAKMPADA